MEEEMNQVRTIEGTLHKGGGNYGIVVGRFNSFVTEPLLTGAPDCLKRHGIADDGVPIVLGVLTTDTTEQAVERAGVKPGNKGWDAAQAALELVDLFGRL
jgi:6,7-dimethyl-8-ribityllumazine synthase